MIKFGTGGWRAIIADGFTKENIRLLTAGLCNLMLREGHGGKEICLGYDRRFLSKESMHWAAEVLAGYGFRPYVINRSVPTPLVMFTVKQMGLPYGMAITASHNPAIYNGIKIFTEGGRDAEASVTKKIEAEIEKLTPGDVKSVPYEKALDSGIIREYGMLYYEETSFSTTPENKQLLKQLVFEKKQLPTFTGKIEKVSYEDGCKVFFDDGSWAICRFSGTEPLLRLAAEGNTPEQAAQLIGRWKHFLGL